MASFIAAAACMAALAAAVVAVPLWRDRHARGGAAIAALLILAGSAGLYSWWSKWDWQRPADRMAAAPNVRAMVQKLEAHMRDQPEDFKGWLMLGRSYLALERWDDSIAAYGHAHQLDSADVEAALGLGEATTLRAGGRIPPAASRLFEQALASQPENPKALLYGGFAAAEAGDYAAARSRWEALRALHPPQQIVELLDARIAELPNGGPAARASTVGPGESGGGDVTVTVDIAPRLKSRLQRETAMFVFATEPGVRGPPLAVKRLTTAALGTPIHLSAADSMLPGHALVDGQRVAITARVSFSGQAMPAPGDLSGEILYQVGHDNLRALIIDRPATDEKSSP